MAQATPSTGVCPGPRRGGGESSPFCGAKGGRGAKRRRGFIQPHDNNHAKNTSPPKSNVTKNLHKIPQMNYTRYQLRHFARQMRNEPTDAEHILWQHLYITSPLMGEG